MEQDQQNGSLCTRPRLAVPGSNSADLRESMGTDEAMSLASANLPRWNLDVDSDGVVMSVTVDPAHTQFGNAMGQDLADLFDPRARKLIKETFAGVAADGKPAELTVPNQTSCQCHLRIAPGSPGRLNCEITNLSLKRCMKNRIAKLQSLESASLVASQIAHDINNKLTIVTGNLSLLELNLEESDLNSSEESLRKAGDAIGDTKVSVGRLRSLANAFELATEALDLRQIAANVAGEFRAAGCNCKVAVPGNLHLVEGDQHLLILAISHLLMNAWEAAGTENVVVTILDIPQGSDVDTMLPDGPAVLVRVEDTGPGLTPDEARLVYQPFYTTKNDAEGIGLSIIRAIAGRHDGIIRCVTDVEGGCFELLLPAVEEPTSCAAEPERGETDQLRVLILDDDPSILEVTGEMLEMFGHFTFRVETVDEAVAVLKKETAENRKVDLVILDMIIQEGPGGMEGLGALRAIQPTIPAIACSGQPTNPAVCDPSAFGFNAVLCKPYSVQALQAAVETVLGQ